MLKQLITLIICLTISCSLNAQVSFFPDLAKNPVWYVLSVNKLSCDGSDCYVYKRVERYIVVANATNLPDRSYRLYRSVYSANYATTLHVPEPIGTLTKTSDGKVYFTSEGLYSNGWVAENVYGGLLYDPDAQIGDTIKAGYHVESSGYIFETPSYVITDIDSVDMTGSIRKRWKTSAYHPGQYWNYGFIDTS